MAAELAAIVLLGALAGGFVNGLTGFGTGLTAIGIWLYVLPPPVAATLVILTSVVAQLQSASLVWRDLDLRRLAPYLIGGLVGVPIGAWLLPRVDPALFRIGVGTFLVLYATAALAQIVRSAGDWGGRPADLAVGMLSGMTGGLAGLSGPLMAVWTDIRGAAKADRRMLLQAFNLTMLTAALVAHAVAGLLSAAVGVAFLAALPGTLIGAWAGARLYQRLGDRSYQRIVMLVLLVSGLGLLVTSARSSG